MGHPAEGTRPVVQYSISCETAQRLQSTQNLSLKWLRIKPSGKIEIDDLVDRIKNIFIDSDRYLDGPVESALFQRAREAIGRSSKRPVVLLSGDEFKNFHIEHFPDTYLLNGFKKMKGMKALSNVQLFDALKNFGIDPIRGEGNIEALATAILEKAKKEFTPGLAEAIQQLPHDRICKQIIIEHFKFAHLCRREMPPQPGSYRGSEVGSYEGEKGTKYPAHKVPPNFTHMDIFFHDPLFVREPLWHRRYITYFGLT